MSFAVDVGHEELAARVIVGLEDDCTAYYIGVTFYQSATVGQHIVGSVKMCRHLPIDVACRLFHAEQDVVDVLYRHLQGLLGITHRLLS